MRFSLRLFSFALLLITTAVGCGKEGYQKLGGDLGSTQARLTITVPGDQATVQAAVDAAAAGDVISVDAGAYGQVVFDAANGTASPLTLTGVAGTVFTGSIVVRGALEVTLENFAAQGNYTGDGLIIENGATVTVRKISAAGYRYAVIASTGTTVNLESSQLRYNDAGVVFDGVAASSVTNSLVSFNNYAGIATIGASVADIEHNTVVGNAYSGTTDYINAGIAVGPAGSGSVKNNIVISNFFGMNCYACAADFNFNDVWGNTTDYINDAAKAPSDKAADPLFVDASNGDFHLTASSPCRDVGTDLGIIVDADGLPRPFGGAPDLGAFEFVVSTSGLVISEVMANPLVEDTGEFVELYNGGGSAIDLAGMLITDGDALDVLVLYAGASSVLAPGAYAVVLDSEYAGQYTIPGAAVQMTTGNTNVGNGLTTSDPITLFEADGATVIDTFSFPFDPGNGTSVEKVELASGDVITNWRGSSCSATPGDVNCSAGTLPPLATGIVISEVMANPVDEATGEFIELYNPGSVAMDLLGVQLSDGGGTDTLAAFAGGTTILDAGARAVIVDSGYASQYLFAPGTVVVTTGDATLGNGLALGDSLTLYEADGTTVMDTYTAITPAPGNGSSVEKIDLAVGDTPTNWAPSSCLLGYSAGRLNCQAGGMGPALVISEVMANPLNEDTGEFIEITNVIIGNAPIDLAGLRITDGDAIDTLQAYQGSSTVISGGQVAVVLDAEYAGEYTFPAGTVLLTTGDTSLGNNLSVANKVSLLEADGSLIDRYGFPQNPGNGVSVEKVSLTAGDTLANWSASSCALGSSPGSTNCGGGTGFSGTTLVITEVMANPLDEGTGEFVELYNHGTTAVDAFGLVLYDFDAPDLLRGYLGGPTLIPAGGYAIVMDSGYAGDYVPAPGAVLLTTADAAICSGLATNDPIVLLEADGSSIIDRFDFPTNPGNGVSLEKIDPTGANEAANWQASTCASGSSPGGPGC